MNDPTQLKFLLQDFSTPDGLSVTFLAHATNNNMSEQDSPSLTGVLVTGALVVLIALVVYCLVAGLFG